MSVLQSSVDAPAARIETGAAELQHRAAQMERLAHHPHAARPQGQEQRRDATGVLERVSGGRLDQERGARHAEGARPFRERVGFGAPGPGCAAGDAEPRRQAPPPQLDAGEDPFLAGGGQGAVAKGAAEDDGGIGGADAAA